MSETSPPDRPGESAPLLHYLYQHAVRPEFTCRFQWRVGSLAFWDNRCAQHRAMWDYWPHTRHGNRVTVAGDRPVTIVDAQVIQLSMLHPDRRV